MIELRTKEFWKTTIALSIGSLLIFANVYFTQPILPVLSQEFNVSSLAANMTVSFVILALGLSLFFYGPFSDSVGRRGIMIITMALATVTTFLAAFAPTFESLIVIRVLQGVFLAGLPSLAVAYIGEEYSAKALSLAIGIYISGNTIGGMFGRAFSGILTDLVSWRFAFIAMGCVSLICLFIFIWLLQPSKNFVQKKFNWRGTLTDYRAHLSNKELRLAYLVGGLHFMIFVGHFSYITFLLSSPPYLLPPSIIGLLFLTYIAGTISSPLSGKLAARWPKAVCIEVGIAIMVVGFLLTLQGSVIAIITGLLLNCFGFFFAHSTASSWVSSRAKSAKASAAGLYLIFYYIGGSLGPLYLEPFWNLLNWQGIVLGSMFILILTTFLGLKMKKIETQHLSEPLKQAKNF
ncbi:MFS transporter [Halalkalibacter nanhaiisediminis]|uniref:YNFM family putative membrane transporter n=1 Tax=Halalkalibacter nanhaiisediminis TaxID=688079 RepID=A0A562QCR7_9BACI|nr:MFS transporter [Halalkalibacter nanhaiisediminis]TWI54524.1 YNFM family putative membrane transporter [Halalkalibacter nanhaiisediminis]